MGRPDLTLQLTSGRQYETIQNICTGNAKVCTWWVSCQSFQRALMPNEGQVCKVAWDWGRARGTCGLASWQSPPQLGRHLAATELPEARPAHNRRTTKFGVNAAWGWVNIECVNSFTLNASTSSFVARQGVKGLQGFNACTTSVDA